MESETDSSSPAPEVDVERSDFTWMIFNFNDWFQQLSVKPQNGSQDEDVSEVVLLSEEFTRGQYVGRTSRWQLELSRNEEMLTVALRCNHCYHNEIEGIWTRCCFDIVDVHGTALLPDPVGLFDDESLWEATPLAKLEADDDSWFWTEFISMSDLSAKWKEYVPRNILILRVKMYVYNEEPPDIDVDTDPPAITGIPKGIVGLSAGSEAFVNAERSSQFLQAVGKLWDTMEAADLTIKTIDGGILRAHFVVSVQSSVLKEMIKQAENDSESGSGTTVINVSGCPLPVFKILLKYLYLQEAEEIDTSLDIDFVKSLLDSSSQFKVEPLAQKCTARFITLLTLENFPRLALASFRNVAQADPLLKREMHKFLMKNQEELQESEGFKVEAKTQPDEFTQLCLYNPCDELN